MSVALRAWGRRSWSIEVARWRMGARPCVATQGDALQSFDKFCSFSSSSWRTLDEPRHARRVEEKIHRLDSWKDSSFGGVSMDDERTRAPRPQEQLDDEQRAMMRTILQYTREKDWRSALDVLDRIPVGADRSWMPLYRAALDCCCKSSHYEAAKIVWDMLPARDIMCYNMMISLCGKLGRTDEAAELFARTADDSQVERTGITYGSMLSAWADGSRWESALSTLEELKHVGSQLHPEPHWELVYLLVMTSCSRVGNMERVRELIAEMKDRGGFPRHAHYNALLCGSQGDPVKVDAAFEEMRHAGHHPRVVDWSVRISCHRERFSDARRIYEEMCSSLLPSETLDSSHGESVFASLLQSAARNSDREAGQWILEQMRAHGIDPEQPKSPRLRRSIRFDGWILAPGAATTEASHREAFSAPATAVTEATHASAHAVPVEPTPQGNGSPALPAGWSSAVDPTTGATYYWQINNPAGTTTWARPTM